MKGQASMGALASAAIGLFVFFMVYMFTIEMNASWEADMRTSGVFVQGPYINESLGTLTEIPLAFTATYYPIVPTATYEEKVYVGNETGYTLLTKDTDYTIDEETGVVTVTADYTGDIGNEIYTNMTYEAFGGDGYDNFVASSEKIMAAQGDMSDIPGIYVMILIITLIAGVLVVFR